MEDGRAVYLEPASGSASGCVRMLGSAPPTHRSVRNYHAPKEFRRRNVTQTIRFSVIFFFLQKLIPVRVLDHGKRNAASELAVFKGLEQCCTLWPQRIRDPWPGFNITAGLRSCRGVAYRLGCLNTLG